MCYYLKVSSNAYYHWKKTQRFPLKERQSDFWKKKIEEIFLYSDQTYGSHRISEELKRRGEGICRSYVGRLMKEMGLKSVITPKFVVTTDSSHQFNVSPNLLRRNFETNAPGKAWVSDITYIKTKAKWVYLTTIMDLFDRKIVGWSLSEDMSADNTIIKAWQHARSRRSIEQGFVFHSDRGIQYACNKTRSVFHFNTMASQSMSAKGDCWDNAVAESFFKTIKCEKLNRYKFENYDQVYQAVNQYIEDWYNTRRLHSSLGYKTPIEVEQEYYFKQRKMA
jgi:transposase InsO family protein